MRWAGLSSFLKDPWVLINLALRIALFAIVLRTHGYLQADSQYYLDNAKGICQGAWGGDSVRTPMYSWLLCAFSFSKLGQIELILLFQTLAIWICGLFLYREDYRTPAFLWLFDPVLLAYSNMVMTDVLFALAVLGLALSLRNSLQNKKFTALTWLSTGVWSGVAILLRPIGLPLIAVTWGIFSIYITLKKIPLKGVAYSSAILFLLLSPVLFWNYSQSHRWYLARQGDGWIQSVAGVVQYRGSGLGFYESEVRWHTEHPGAGTPQAYETIKQHWPSWVILSVQGMARVLVGNINSEYAAILTGHVPLGPGWFKEGTQDSPNKVRGISAVVWIFGVLATLIFSLTVYCVLGLKLFKAWPSLSVYCRIFIAWLLASAALLVTVPQVYGDARFRAPVWALVTVCFSELSISAFSRKKS